MFPTETFKVQILPPSIMKLIYKKNLINREREREREREISKPLHVECCLLWNTSLFLLNVG